ncbi:LOW QUALITY PROTEIN: proteasome inhibitor PI31 subunit [Cyclopterus lumpus]|uniref:LOW QUALITY PROTEIN: proteasome inhibitor PI31 subunit n=1 Tax=Cyclopterus lumpus TaxID=8103 RepID=UPI001486CFCC|nr:LOW QUALITY PROTEIN: proteasome inhibitor PI31 subunit [Cyclopterus lumpus]
MAGLEVLYTCVGGRVTCPQDAVVCFVHWEMIKSGYRCVGSGDEPLSTDRRSELLPPDWSSNNELYSLRYESRDGDAHLLKAIAVDSTLIFNLMNSGTQQVSELTVNIVDHVDSDQLHTFHSVFKEADGLTEKVKTQLLPPQDRPPGPRKRREEEEEEEEQRRRREDSDPLRIPNRQPRQGPPPHWHNPVVPPFAAGGADLDPFGSRGGGGMIVDPLRSGYPRSGFDPSSGIPDILPPGAVPPGARFDPFGPPVGRPRPRPDPDHMPPPGYDDMFM